MIAPVDAAARQLITDDGLDATLFVEAGAGTGKTSTLVRRIVNLVTQRDVDLREVAAITFTEAAAAELRDRVRTELERAAAGGDPVAAERARRAAGHLDGAAISTLHSFAQRLLSEHPVEVGIPPRVEVLDEVQSTLAFEARWREAFDNWMGDPQLDELLTRTTLARIEISSTTRASLRDVAAVLGQNWDRLEGFAAGSSGVAPLSPLRVEPLHRALHAVLALPRDCCDDDDTLAKHLAGLERVHRAILTADPHRALRLMATKTKWARRLGAKGNWADVGAARAALDEADALADSLFAAVVDEVLDRWLALLARFTLDAAHERQRAGRLEFHDLLVLARRLLRTVPEARQSLRDRYTHLLLDEFQDTDPIQIELAVMLATPHHPANHESWADVSTDAGRLFFVGDPKQSIYRFRRADIGLFLRARDRFGGDGAVQLVQNFRSTRPVLEWVNHVFGAVMAEEKPNRQPRYEPLVAARPGHPEIDHRVVLLGGPHGDDVKADELRHREAADVAASILAIRADPAAWLVERRPGEWVEPAFADITILLPSRTSLPMLEEALRNADIPWRADTSTLVFDTNEVRELLTVLRAVDDPADALAVVASYRSPLFGCADTELFDFHEAGGSWDYRDRPPASLDASHPVVTARAALARWHDERLWCEPSVLFDRIVRERQVFALALTQRRPRDTWRRVRFLTDQARRFSEAGGGDVRAFLAWADLQRSEGARVPEPMLPETDDDAVRVMTCHGAKGLEFPITIVSGLTTRKAGGRRGVHVLWNDDAPPAIRLNKNIATDHFEARNDFEDEMDADEKVRLLYVGATRARDHLIISAHHKAGADDCHGALVWQHSEAVLGQLCRRLRPVAQERTLPFPTTRPAASAAAVEVRDQWLAARAALLADGDHPRTWSATAIAAEIDEHDRSGVVARRGRAGTAFGRAVHAVLQFADVEVGDDALRQRANVEAAAEGVPELAPDVAAAALAARRAAVVQRINASGRVWRELFVAAELDGVVVEGFIDLLGETPDGLVLVDYKTDAVEPGELDAAVDRYRPQAATYALALERVTGRPVVECCFVFAAPDGAFERPVEDLSAAKAEVLAFLSVGRDSPARQS